MSARAPGDSFSRQWFIKRSPARGGEARPISTEGWTRRVHFVREGGGGGGEWFIKRSPARTARPGVTPCRARGVRRRRPGHWGGCRPRRGANLGRKLR